MFRRRETMIALRARRQAFQIASQIAHPHVEPPPRALAVDAPPEEPVVEPNVLDEIGISRATCWIVLVCVVLFAIAWLVLNV